MISYIRFTLFLSIISGSLGQYCPDSWKQFRTESCFKLVQQAVTKDNAVAVCAIEDSSSSLGSIKSDALQKFITKYVYEEQGSTQNVWIGGVRTPDGTGFTWADKEPLEFTNWEQGRPNTTDRTKRCMQINVNSGTWRDVDCMGANHVLCQLDLPWTFYSKQIKTLQDQVLSLENKLVTKANETELDELQATVVVIQADYIKNADIEAVKTDLELKATQSSLEELDSGLRNYIDTSLLAKADKMSLDMLEGSFLDLVDDFNVVKLSYVDKQSFSDAESRLQTSIDSKANQADLITLTSSVSDVKAEVLAFDTNLGYFSGNVTLELTNLNQEVSNLKASDIETNAAIDILRDNVNEKANQVDLVTLNSNLSAVKTEVEGLDTKLSDLKGKVEVELPGLTSAILEIERDILDLKGNVSDLEGKANQVNERVGALETSVENSLKLKANQTEVDGISAALEGEIRPKLVQLFDNASSHGEQLTNLDARVKLLEDQTTTTTTTASRILQS